jgi:hypothetical protein
MVLTLHREWAIEDLVGTVFPQSSLIHTARGPDTDALRKAARER